jgi:uncharacterized protein (TIGR02996 family)
VLSDEGTFLAAIKVTPLDEAAHGAYADWLDEHDRPEEADRQRQWVKAFDFIKQFTREIHDGYEYDDDGERVPGSLKFDYRKVMDEVEWWRTCVTGEEQRYGLGRSIGFATDEAPDMLTDPATRKKFWECFYVLTGVQAPEELRNQKRYSCAC